MKITYETQGSKTYLVYEVQQNDSMDSTTLHMMTNNKINGLADAIFTQIDQNKFIKYNVSAKITAAQMFNGIVNKKRIIGLFKSIVDAFISAEEYMIDVNEIILDLKYIFVDVSSCKGSLICLPVNRDNDNSNSDILSFFKSIMVIAQFDQTENCDYVAKLINFFNLSPNIQLEEYRMFLNNLENDNLQVNIREVNIKEEIKENTNNTHSENSSINSRNYADNKNKVDIPSRANLDVNDKKNSLKNRNNNVAIKQDKIIKEQEKMSLGKLLMHFSNDNLALYKEQRKSNKKGSDTIDKKLSKSNNVKTDNVKKNKSKKINNGFSVPGREDNVGNNLEDDKLQEVNNSSIQNDNVTNNATNNDASKRDVRQVNYEHKEIEEVIYPETTIIGDFEEEGTSLLVEEENVATYKKPYLIRSSNNDKVLINKSPFRIGKERTYVDYFVDNNTISRSHANIIIRDSDYYLVDTNSTNHTYLNDRKIDSNKEEKIQPGDIIRFSNEVFKFDVL